jgi:hypothetical protein
MMTASQPGHLSSLQFVVPNIVILLKLLNSKTYNFVRVLKLATSPLMY